MKTTSTIRYSRRTRFVSVRRPSEYSTAARFDLVRRIAGFQAQEYVFPILGRGQNRVSVRRLQLLVHDGAVLGLGQFLKETVRQVRLSFGVLRILSG